MIPTSSKFLQRRILQNSQQLWHCAWYSASGQDGGGDGDDIKDSDQIKEQQKPQGRGRGRGIAGRFDKSSQGGIGRGAGRGGTAGSLERFKQSVTGRQPSPPIDQRVAPPDPQRQIPAEKPVEKEEEAPLQIEEEKVSRDQTFAWTRLLQKARKEAKGRPTIEQVEQEDKDAKKSIREKHLTTLKKKGSEEIHIGHDQHMDALAVKTSKERELHGGRKYRHEKTFPDDDIISPPQPPEAQRQQLSEEVLLEIQRGKRRDFSGLDRTAEKEIVERRSRSKEAKIEQKFYKQELELGQVKLSGRNRVAEEPPLVVRSEDSRETYVAMKEPAEEEGKAQLKYVAEDEYRKQQKLKYEVAREIVYPRQFPSVWGHRELNHTEMKDLERITLIDEDPNYNLPIGTMPAQLQGPNYVTLGPDQILDEMKDDLMEVLNMHSIQEFEKEREKAIKWYISANEIASKQKLKQGELDCQGGTKEQEQILWGMLEGGLEKDHPYRQHVQDQLQLLLKNHTWTFGAKAKYLVGLMEEVQIE
eukprot:TRINITY_DN16664_c0_g3_i1.p1 TRINITY_DN16664_c0_g3~~TRINITY_DN16664_c0_g3_i1.p1  ORF type:complete len:529 (+),score=118.83 TRINITY_DN16664_c0_g3_i1:25-1611(+)